MDNILQRLAGGAQWGPGNVQPQEYDEWNQMVGSAPPDRFGSVAYEAVRQVDPQDYYRHIQPGVDGTDPLGALPRRQRTDVARNLISQLMGSGVGRNQIRQGAGIPTTDVRRLSPQELASLLQWTQQNRPDALGQVAAQYQNQPDILSSLLGNRALMGLVTGLGSQLMGNQMSGRDRY